MNTRILITLSVIMINFQVITSDCYGQGLGINSSSSEPNPASLLDVNSTTRGVLISRMTTDQRNTLGAYIVTLTTDQKAAAEGLLIFNTTTKCFEAYLNGGWYSVSCPSPCTPPAAPTVSAASGISFNSFIANWSSSTGATSYYLDIASDTGFTSILAAYNNLNVGNVTSYTVTVPNSVRTYYYRVRAGTACFSASSNSVPVTTLFVCGSSTISDADGNTYNTVLIGTQCWMKENLKTTKYNDSTGIPNVTDLGAWNGLTTGAYCDYSNTPSYSVIFGRLYNWYAVTDIHGICPTGWHIPTDAEWTTLTGNLGGETVAGGKLKEAGTSHWYSPNTGATNESGFTALPAGFRYLSWNFADLYLDGNWWYPTETSASYAYARKIYYYSGSIFKDVNIKTMGFSARCLRNE